jgi:hypothetical protein
MSLEFSREGIFSYFLDSLRNDWLCPGLHVPMPLTASKQVLSVQFLSSLLAVGVIQFEPLFYVNTQRNKILRVLDCLLNFQ